MKGSGQMNTQANMSPEKEDEVKRCPDARNKSNKFFKSWREWSQQTGKYRAFAGCICVFYVINTEKNVLS